jgi:cytochrome c oxidase subunit IV
MSHTAHPTQPLDELDPHHESHHHGHVIIRPSTLIAVLVALLVLTGVTVGAAQLEAWIAHTWNIHIPSLFNAFVCLSIAIVKSVLVFMFFMQLKYDTPLNSIVMGFTFFAVGLFFFFTMIDLGNRDAIYPYKSGEIQRGGMGINNQKTNAAGAVISGINTQNKPIVVWARENYLNQIREKQAAGTLVPPLAAGETPEDRFKKESDEAHAHARGGHKSHGEELSTAAKSRAPKAVGPELFAEKKADPAHDPHGGH